jgi:glycosyltransferase involved in cell wall biosynthesis
MRIAVNTRSLITGKLDGIGWFTHEVMKRVVATTPEHEFLFLFDRSFDPEFIYADNVLGKVLFPQARHPLLYRMYFEYSVPKAVKQWKADLFFSTDGILSSRLRIPQIPVIHDLNFEHRPEDLPKKFSNYYRTYFPQFAARASKIITVSDFSASDITSTYGVAREKIQVAHNGANQAYRALSEEEIAKTKKQYSGGKPYIIFVGNFSFRKNIHGVVESYNLYRNSGGQGKLLMVGNPLWSYPEMDQTLAQSTYAEDIVFTGHLDIDHLVLVMGSAQTLLFPSYFEGFGIPVIEAFMANVPVVTSDCTSLPEVAGDAALFASPDDHIALAKNLIAIESNQELREKLIRAGVDQAKKFNWDLTAEKVKSALFGTSK